MRVPKMKQLDAESSLSLSNLTPFFNRTESAERSYVWQKRYRGKAIRISLKTKDEQEAAKRSQSLYTLFLQMQVMNIQLDFKTMRTALTDARDKYIINQMLGMLSSSCVSSTALPLMSEVLTEWMSESSNDWKPKTREVNERTVKAFIEHVGDKPIDQFKKKDVSEYKHYLEERFKAPRSRQDHLVKISGLFTFASKKRDYISSNPFSGMAYKNVESVSEKVAITIEEQHQVLAAKNVVRSLELSWMLKVLYYTGMRISEVIQLRKSDYRDVEGVLCFSVNDEDGKTVKTKDSVRNIPIHASLLEDGIWEDKPTFKWKNSASAGERVRLAFRNIGLTHTPHEYRYGVSDRLRDISDLPDHVRYSILGHSSQVMTDKTYRSKQPLQLMKQAIDKI